MYLSRNAVGKLLERQCTLKGSGQPVLWAAHQVFHYLSHPEKSGILQVDVFSLKCSSNCPPLQETTQILRALLQALANCGSHLLWESSDAATLLAELQHPWQCLTGQVGQQTGIQVLTTQCAAPLK